MHIGKNALFRKTRGRRFRWWKRGTVGAVVLVLASWWWSVPAAVCRAEKWSGVDESVVERFAENAGRAPADPLLNTDQGDLLLFMFLIAGVIGGFIAGYSWSKLFSPSADSVEK
ncbi:MAG: cobalt transporter [Planctomycetota bacterium]|nr:MAG: cobalt transporter [Planctomycetota bacterium]